MSLPTVIGRSDDRLTLEWRPTTVWNFAYAVLGVAGLFAVAGVWSLVAGSGFAVWLPRLLVVPLVAGLGVYILRQSPTVHVSADGRARSLVIRRRGFRLDERLEIPLREIADIRVRAENDSEGATVGFLDVMLRSGTRETVAEVGVATAELAALREMAEELRTVLRLELAAAVSEA